MKHRLTGILVLWLLACPLLHAAIPPGWSTNLTGALTISKQSNAPVLLYFTADWCGPCRQFSAVTLADKSVATQLKQFVPVAVDIDTNEELAARYGVSDIPALLILSPAGDELERQTGYAAPEMFRDWLTHGNGMFTAALVREQMFVKQQAGIDRDLQAPDIDTRRFAVVRLLDLAAEKVPGHQQYAVAAMKTVSATEPQLLLQGLRHPLLATRIQTANVLRERLGTRFDIDPWADTASREKSLVLLEKELAVKK